MDTPHPNRTWFLIYLAICLTTMATLIPAGLSAAERPLVLTIRLATTNHNQVAGQDLQPATLPNPFRWSTVVTPRKPKPVTSKRNRVLEAELANLRLEAILWNRNTPQAIINGRLLSINDQLQGAKVVAIDRQSVLLRKETTEHRLDFVPSSITLNPENNRTDD